MASRKPIKRYALDLVEEMRRDVQHGNERNLPSIDLAEVIRITPEIVVEPFHTNIEYEEDYLIWKIDPDTLKVEDTVVLGRDPSGQPIVLGIADGDNENPFDSPEMKSFQQNTEYLRENTQHWKVSVTTDDDLPDYDNDDGDLRFSKDTNTIFRWDGDNEVWVAASGASGTFLPTSGGTMTGGIVMNAGTMITLPDAPVNPEDVVNKAYVDALFAICCGGGGGPALTPTVTIDATDSVPCYEALPGDQVILVNTSLGPVTVCLPASHASGKLYEIKDISGLAATNNITITSDDGDSIDGAATYVMNVDLQSITVISDGTDWFVF